MSPFFKNQARSNTSLRVWFPTSVFQLITLHWWRKTGQTSFIVCARIRFLISPQCQKVLLVIVFCHFQFRLLSIVLVGWAQLLSFSFLWTPFPPKSGSLWKNFWGILDYSLLRPTDGKKSSSTETLVSFPIPVVSLPLIFFSKSLRFTRCIFLLCLFSEEAVRVFAKAQKLALAKTICEGGHMR